MAMKLVTENVNILEAQILNEIDYWLVEDKEAAKNLAYIGGVHDMANAVRKMIKELGGV